MFDLHVGRVFLGPFDFSHHLFGDLLAGASEGDGGFFGGSGGKNRDDVLRGRLVAYGDEEKGECSEQKHDTVDEAFDEITEHEVGVSVGVFR